MSYRWIWFIASRYLFHKQKKKPSSVLSVLGIATGVFALIVIIAVMNGFQLSFIESIIEISSYHLRVGRLPEDALEEGKAAILNISEVEAAVPFREFQAIVRGRRGGQQAAMIRGIPADAPALDAAMSGRLEFEEGSFNLDGLDKALIGAELARRLGLRIGGEINLYSIPSIFADDDAHTAARTFTVTGIFRTGYYEYDTGWAFIDIESAAAFSDTGPVLGIKLKNRFHDQRTLELIRKKLSARSGFETAELSSWRDYNRSFFGALRTEKLFMFILVGLIFIVVGLNIYQAQRRAVLEHREEIGLLRAIGSGALAARLIFVCDGAIIGLGGASAGLFLGILTASHISLFFSVLETIVNFFINIVNVIAMFFNSAGVGGFTFFSPAVFYIKEIPSRIITREVVLIFMFGFLSALTAAWFASRKVSRIQAAEVLRYE
ncbi:MAG: ABC transporter permease [Treponema sp.]|jgi:lipoprotein-releasing system permease protein|nr:ABC transporter permease [Treponema sp.]